MSGNFIGHVRSFSKAVLTSLGGYDTRFAPAEDYDLVLRIATKGYPIVYVPKILYSYRLNPEGLSMSSGFKANIMGAKLAISEAFERLGVSGVEVPDPIRRDNGCSLFLPLKRVEKLLLSSPKISKASQISYTVKSGRI